MFGTATLKAQLPFAVRVHGTWSRGRCEERSDIEELVNWRGTSWWRYVDCILYAKVASLKLIRLEIGSQCNDSSRGWASHDFRRCSTTRAKSYS